MPLNMIRPLGNGKFQTPTGVFDSYAEAVRSVTPRMSPVQAQPSFGNRMATMADQFNDQRQEAALKSSPSQPMSPEYIMSQKQGGLLDAPSAPQKERSFMDKLSSQEGLGSLGALMLSMSNNPNLQKLGMAELGDIQKRGSTNKTIKALRDAKREDLANAVESGMLGASDAAKILFAEKKEKTPIKLGAGETLIDPTTLKTIASGLPKDSTFKEKVDFYNQNPELAQKMNIFGGSSVNVSSEGAIPAGYQAVRDESGRIIRIEPYQGSKPVEAAEKAAEQGARASNIVIEDINRLKQNILKQDLFNPTTGALGWVAGFFPSSGRVDAENLARTITANVGFDRLQQMREASPTGGALGSVSDRELRTLQAVLGSLELSQSEDQLIENLDRLNEIYSVIIKKFSAYPNASEYGFSSAGVSLEDDPNGLFE